MGVEDSWRRMIRCEVRVPHRCRDIPMHQQFLNGPKIHAFHHPLTHPEVPEIVKPTHSKPTALRPVIERPADRASGPSLATEQKHSESHPPKMH
jgi:hypothetical protein